MGDTTLTNDDSDQTSTAPAWSRRASKRSVRWPATSPDAANMIVNATDASRPYLASDVEAAPDDAKDDAGERTRRPTCTPRRANCRTRPPPRGGTYERRGRRVGGAASRKGEDAGAALLARAARRLGLGAQIRVAARRADRHEGRALAGLQAVRRPDRRERVEQVPLPEVRRVHQGQYRQGDAPLHEGPALRRRRRRAHVAMPAAAAVAAEGLGRGAAQNGGADRAGGSLSHTPRGAGAGPGQRG